MEQAWKRASMLFSAAAIFYGLGLAFDLIYIIQYNFEYCLDHDDYYCHIEGQAKYSLFAGLILTGGLAKVSFDQSKRISDPNRFTLSIPKGNTENQYGLTNELGIGHLGSAYLFGLANFFLLFVPSIDAFEGDLVISSIIIHFILTIFYFISYKGEFFIGLSLSFVTVVGIFFLVFVTSFSEFSILLLVLGGLTYLITMIVNHTRGLHGISVGMLYGAPISFFGAVFFIAFLVFGEL